MALTLPVEELIRLQITFRLSPDDLLTFDMLSNPNTSSPPLSPLSGYKLHLKGSRDGSGLCLKVWAHYDGDCQPDQPRCETGVDTESSDLQSPQSTEEPCITENEYDVGSGSNIVHYDTHTEPTWYDYQEANGAMQLANAFAPAEPICSFNNDPWFKDNAPLEVLGNVGESRSTAPQPGACFEKHNVSDYHDSQSILYSTLLSGVDTLCAQNAAIPAGTAHSRPELRILPTTIAYSASVDSSMSPYSDASSPTNTSSAPSPNNSSRPYRCLDPTCDRWFKRDYTRKVHMLTHRRRDRKPFGCSFPGCSERFSRKHDRLRHEVSRHGLESEWTCQPCHRFFSSRSTMERHIFDKHGDDVSKSWEAG
ncbi:hypothetical protein M378DRAFT_322370 [Amanita muscaria Koide BX008]|uniref:C2H2-type domain-containing protein n=1 Tax=Amanita muscaria (strain Koide BX008) TaxID=946122 RepID=A0A0C2XC85_AMAMK|nr:hypothetical protein M378DRAFT_322370 [Amanita muscaria Koide BX008]